jgi:amidase
VSRHGIIPIAASQDIAGPFARTVRDAAMLLSAMVAPDAPPHDYTSVRTDLRGLRLGVVRDYFGADGQPGVRAAFESWLDLLAAAGAELVDPVRLELPDTIGAAELEVLLVEFKAGINAYLASSTVPDLTSLDQLIAFNTEHAGEVMPHFDQDILLMAQARGGLGEPAHREALEASQVVVRERFAAVFAAHRLHALVAPVNAPAWKTDWVNGDFFSLSSSRVAAVSGYPSVAVPGGLVRELPVAIAFVGQPFTEALLIEIAEVFERSRGAMPQPGFVPSVEQ